MRHIVGLVVSIATLAAALGASQPGSQAGTRVRSDGVYYANVIGDKTATPYFLYFRFYDDSTGLTMYSSRTPEDVAKWLNRNADVQQGKWRLEGNVLIFVVGSELQYTTYSGTLSAEGWMLKGSGTKCEFAPVAFASEAVAPGQNRPPNVDHTPTQRHTYAYNVVGDVTGVTTTIEVKAVDPDGDPLTFTWTVSTGSVTGNGPRCVWQRPIESGRPASGTVTLVVTDSKGAMIRRTWSY